MLVFIRFHLRLTTTIKIDFTLLIASIIAFIIVYLVIYDFYTLKNVIYTVENYIGKLTRMYLSQSVKICEKM